MEMTELTIEIPKSQIQERNNRFQIFYFELLCNWVFNYTFLIIICHCLGLVLDFFHFPTLNLFTNFNYSNASSNFIHDINGFRQQLPVRRLVREYLVFDKCALLIITNQFLFHLEWLLMKSDILYFFLIITNVHIIRLHTVLMCQQELIFHFSIRMCSCLY